MIKFLSQRREMMKLSMLGMAGAAAAVGSASLGARQAAAQAAANSQLRTVLDRGKLLVGTGSTNAPWHFENEKGELVGMDIAMARILAKGLFDDESKVEFVRQDPAQRIPNINTGKVDIVIQFMTVNPQRAQLVHFTRPYYVEGVALLVRHDAEMKTYDALMKAGSKARISILQNADADTTVKAALPQATILQLDTQANVIQAIDSRRADAAAVDLSTVQWITKRQPDRYADAGKKWYSMLYSAALRQGDPDWLRFVNTTFEVAMYGHQNAIYDKALQDFFGLEPPVREPGLPRI
ncbi:transporter substrate-binding domain-containing protein [Microvirga massiliensis]|uniref:transporter substrate-binding domain-containing protein n=1 Tax=Microvirga massiliensis TaxID=1033741 RepID=UPI000AB7AA21